MAEYVSVASPQTVATDQNVLFVDSIPCTNGSIVHRNGSGIFTLRGATSGCNTFARYRVTFNGNIAIPEGGTLAAIATAIAINGEPDIQSRGIVTPGAVDEYMNVTNTKEITVPSGCCFTVAIENVNAGVDGQVVAQQPISVADANLVITRTA